ncbi:hypothetical protein ACQ9BO_19690 [Flavobacterium sp. P21]|uniref:hypothetical protein n=1 Tax=Flavobacterium sp. P21 TaxID=3423948 RepID=UPI003D676D02
MKIVTIHTEQIQTVFEELNANFDGKIAFDFDEYKLEINNSFARGTITGASFNDNISYVQFDMTFSTPVRIDFLNVISTPVYFAYCSKGSLKHSFGIDGEERKFKTFQTAILASNQNQDNILFFEKDINTKLTLIIVGTQAEKSYLMPSLNQKVKETFLKIMSCRISFIWDLII